MRGRIVGILERNINKSICKYRQVFREGEGRKERRVGEERIDWEGIEREGIEREGRRGGRGEKD